MKSKTFILSTLLMFVLACGSLTPTPSQPTAPTAAPVTFTAIPSLTPASPAVPTTGAVAQTAVLVDVSADNVVLRSNPGTMFPAILTLRNHETLTAYGRALGDGWLFVRTEQNVAGWVSTRFVTIAPVELPLLSAIQPSDVQVLHGTVMDADYNPISGVGFAVVQGNIRNDAISDSGGHLYFYLPLSASGTWTISYVSLNCNSNVMGPNCKCKSTICKPSPEVITFTLPAQEVFQFEWK